MRVPFPPARITPRIAISRLPWRDAASGSQLPVLLLVILHVLARPDGSDPRRVLLIPPDRVAQAPVEGHPPRPAEFALRLVAVDRVPPVVPRPVLHVADQRLRLAEQFEQQVRQFQVRLFATAA